MLFDAPEEEEEAMLATKRRMGLDRLQVDGARSSALEEHSATWK